MSKTQEEISAARRAKDIVNLTTNFKGISKTSLAKPAIPSSTIDGLQLSDLQFKPLNFFKPHPANTVFDRLKTANYWRDLKRDIREAKAILDPVICLPDGTLIEGHSRVRIAKELATEGLDLGKIPTIFVASPISPSEVERRIYLGNLSRFEIDEDTRLELYSKIWPGWYKVDIPLKKESYNGKGETVSPPLPTRAKTAADLGKSERQIKNDAALMREAEKEAKTKGKSQPDIDDIKAAREKAKQKRRTKTLTKEQHILPFPVATVRLTKSEIDETIRALSIKLNARRREIITKLKKARAVTGR